jgi:hypothetical protein
MCVDCKFWPAMAGFGANPGFGCPLMNPAGFYMLMCTARGLFTLPTDVLIEDGRIVEIFHGKVIGQHMPMDRVLEFAGTVGGEEMQRT